MPNALRFMGTLMLALLMSLSAGCGNSAKDLPPPPAGEAKTTPVAPPQSGPVEKQEPDEDEPDEDAGDEGEDGGDEAAPAEKTPAAQVPEFKGEATAISFEKAGMNFAMELPKSWTKEEPANNMRAFQAAVPKHEQDKQGATLTLSLASGGVDANIKRYVGMFGGDQSLKEKATLKTAGGATATVADLEGPYTAPAFMGGGQMAEAKMLIAIVPMGTRQMFIKLLGPRHTVDEHKPGFLHLVKTFSAK